MRSLLSWACLWSQARVEEHSQQQEALEQRLAASEEQAAQARQSAAEAQSAASHVKAVQAELQVRCDSQLCPCSTGQAATAQLSSRACCRCATA